MYKLLDTQEIVDEEYLRKLLFAYEVEDLYNNKDDYIKGLLDLGWQLNCVRGAKEYGINKPPGFTKRGIRTFSGFSSLFASVFIRSNTCVVLSNKPPKGLVNIPTTPLPTSPMEPEVRFFTKSDTPV